MAIAYIGGKYRQAKWIEEFIPKEMKTYAEVFGGAFWVYLKSTFKAESVHYNDFNRFMVNLFACCQQPERFHKFVDAIEPQDAERYEKFKKDVLPMVDDKFDYPDFLMATKYVYLVTQTFSGIMSEKGKMVDLKGKYRSKYLSFKDRLMNPKFQKRFEKIVAHNESYEDFIPIVDSPDTFLYLDPPYYNTESLYAFHSFGLEDHEKLANILKECKSKWLLSYYEFDDLSKWFPKDKYHWEYKEYKKASMAGKGKKQSTGVEVLVMNY